MRHLFVFVAITCAAISSSLQVQADPPNPVAESDLAFVATHPLETDFETGMLETKSVWNRLIDASSKSLDLAFFYASDHGEDGAQDPENPTALSGVFASLRRAAERGVKVRFLADTAFQDTYPALLDQLDQITGIEARCINLKPLTGGVMHAKYLIADRTSVYAGSANFDWRSLEHILELGVELKPHSSQRDNTAPFVDIFELDWHLATGGSPEDLPQQTHKGATTYQAHFQQGGATTDTQVLITPVFSPKSLLPNEDQWDLPHIIDRIQNAKQRVWIQVMTFRMKDRDGEVFDDLQNAILQAAERGVEVRLLVADWGKRRGTIEGLQSLSALKGIDVRMVTIPEHSSGHIPFGRVIHAKYLIVDQDKAWVGSSNWERDYFYESRNVGVLLDGQAAIQPLATLFQTVWGSSFAYNVDPEAEYAAPNFGDRE